MDPLRHGDRSDADTGLIGLVGNYGSFGRESDALVCRDMIDAHDSHIAANAPPLDAHFH